MDTFANRATSTIRGARWAVPALLILAAVLLGLVARALGAVAAASRRRRTRRRLVVAVAEVA